MHSISRMICLCLLLLASGKFVIAQHAAGHATNSAQAKQTQSAGASATAARYSGSSLLCAGLLGSGLLADVFTVAPIAPRDPNSAIQFGPIWSDAHQATVKSPTPEQPRRTPAVATVKLPISFSEIDRQKFAAAGWQPRQAEGGHGLSYCIDHAVTAGADASQSARGMICVSSVP